MLTHIHINAWCALNDHFRLNTNLKKKNVQLNIYERKKKSLHLKTLEYLCFLNLFLTLSTHFQSKIINLIKKTQNSLAVQWLGHSAFTAGAQVPSLVGELRSQKLCCM